MSSRFPWFTSGNECPGQGLRRGADPGPHRARASDALLRGPTMFQMLLESPDLPRPTFPPSASWSPEEPLCRKDSSKRIKPGRASGCGKGSIDRGGPNNFMANGKPGTVGNPMPHVDVRVADPQGKEVPPGQDGNCSSARPYLRRVLEKPEATAESIRGDVHTGIWPGWMKTATFRSWGEKRHDHLRGINIYPAEIEKAIEGHPRVAAAAVIGCPTRNGERWVKPCWS